jgi:hypothetical protein
MDDTPFVSQSEKGERSVEWGRRRRMQLYAQITFRVLFSFHFVVSLLVIIFRPFLLRLVRFFGRARLVASDFRPFCFSSADKATQIKASSCLGVERVSGWMRQLLPVVQIVFDEGAARTQDANKMKNVSIGLVFMKINQIEVSAAEEPECEPD